MSDDNLTLEEIYNAYNICLKNKKNKAGTFNFVNDNLCVNLITLLDELNSRTYRPKSSNCYVISDPAYREIYAAQFSDRIVQHFYMNEIGGILENELIDGCCSCRKFRGTDYALDLLNKYVQETSKKGKEDCFFLKMDLSGYFMSIDRRQVSYKFYNLIKEKYKGKHKKLLLFLTPLIFEDNPAKNCNYRCDEESRRRVPERRRLNEENIYGMAIGNLTAQAGSNLNLNNFDHYVIKKLKIIQYVRYVDDAIFISKDKETLEKALPLLIDKLQETHQKISLKKTKIDTAYHGVPFLGKITYPYGYQKPNKQVIKRTYQRAKRIKYDSVESLLAKTNSQIGTLKRYNCRKLIINYNKKLPKKVHELIEFDVNNILFKKKRFDI